MSDEKLGQEPAFSSIEEIQGNYSKYWQTTLGMSKRVYAAIKLGIPDSGEKWLDKMIVKSNRRKAACAAMQGLLSNADWTRTAKMPDDFDEYKSRLVSASFEFANELLKQE